MIPNAVRLPLRIRVGYGVAEIGMSAAEVMLQVFLFKFYTSAVGLDEFLTGIALGLAVLWDALVDPAMGAVSDRTSSRWGRRRPYIIVGSLALATTTYFLFSPPELGTQTAKFIYLLIFYALVNTSMTIINVPHSALAGELSMDRNERTELFGWRMLFKNVGFLFGAIYPSGLLDSVLASGGTEFDARSQASVVLAIAVVLSALITATMVGKYDRPFSVLPGKKIGAWRQFKRFLKGVWSVARNPVFAPVLWGFVIAQVGRTINSSLALHYYQVRMGFSEKEVGQYILGVLIIVITLSLPVWVWLARKYGKKRPAFIGAMLMGVLTMVGYPLLPPGVLWVSVLYASVICGAVVGSIVLFDSLVADIVDYDELKTREHREGLYFGCWLMATKVSRAIGLGSTGLLLAAIGYDETSLVHTPDTGFKIALLFGPGVGICFILAALVFLWMPLTDARHKRVQELLQRIHARKKINSDTNSHEQ